MPDPVPLGKSVAPLPTGRCAGMVTVAEGPVTVVELDPFGVFFGF